MKFSPQVGAESPTSVLQLYDANPRREHEEEDMYLNLADHDGPPRVPGVSPMITPTRSQSRTRVALQNPGMLIESWSLFIFTNVLFSVRLSFSHFVYLPSQQLDYVHTLFPSSYLHHIFQIRHS